MVAEIYMLHLGMLFFEQGLVSLFTCMTSNKLSCAESNYLTSSHGVFLQPVPEELQNGPGFGYVVAFRPHGATGWMQAAVPSAEASKYVFKNESIQPFSPFHVKVGIYNNEGEGPFGPVTTIYSAEEGGCDFMSSDRVVE